MLKMQLKYAEEFLTKGYSGHWRKVSCHDGLLVIEDLEDYQNSGFLGTQLNDGKFMLDAAGYVVFHRVKPILNEDTRWKLS